jgi:hypothetical protein
MQLKLENWPEIKVTGFGEVAEALVSLSQDADQYFCLESTDDGFVQVRRNKKGFVVEWRQDFSSKGPDLGLARAGRREKLGRVVFTPKDEVFKVYASEMLKLGEAFEILCAFYYGPVRPKKFRWRGLTGTLKRYEKLKKTGKVF